ncbi:hypothetical protein EI94DRAFT_1708588 [Lactarius quietus]|nr:hypothetical protein EI94DRAFT_1708588 [Lactarius quietus]
MPHPKPWCEGCRSHPEGGRWVGRRSIPERGSTYAGSIREGVMVLPMKGESDGKGGEGDDGPQESGGIETSGNYWLSNPVAGVQGSILRKRRGGEWGGNQCEGGKGGEGGWWDRITHSRPHPLDTTPYPAGPNMVEGVIWLQAIALLFSQGEGRGEGTTTQRRWWWYEVKKGWPSSIQSLPDITPVPTSTSSPILTETMTP